MKAIIQDLGIDKWIAIKVRKQINPNFYQYVRNMLHNRGEKETLYYLRWQILMYNNTHNI